MERASDSMWTEILYQAYEVIIRFFNKGVLLLSTIAGLFLSAIGFPKEIIVFVFALTVIDIITKHLSLVISHYGTFSFPIYYQAWKDRVLTSRQLKNGIFVKVAIYSFILYVSNKLAIIPEIFLGKEISGGLYTALCLVEVSSIFENFIDSGVQWLKPFRAFFQTKQEQVLGGTVTQVKEGE